MSKSLSIGQIWLMERMVESPHGSYCTLTGGTSTCPAPVTTQELRCLEKRGLCTRQQIVVFVITDRGREMYKLNRQRLADAKAVQDIKSEAEWRAEDAKWAQPKEKQER